MESLKTLPYRPELGNMKAVDGKCTSSRQTGRSGQDLPPNPEKSFKERGFDPEEAPRALQPDSQPASVTVSLRSIADGGMVELFDDPLP